AAFVIATIAQVAAANACGPASPWESAPATRLGEADCANGPQQHQELEVFNIEKAGAGRITVSILVISAEARTERGLVVRIGPYAPNGYRMYRLIDADELEGLVRFLDEAISNSARAEPPARETRAYALTTKAGLGFVSYRGALGGISI